MANNNTEQVPKITLYSLEESRSERIVWLLEELNVPYAMKRFKRGENMLADPALKDIHPLGKSPVITIETAKPQQPMVLAESGPIVEYIVEYYGPHMIPKRYENDEVRSPGGETEAWLRDRYFTHYAEGSLMTLLIVALIINKIRDAPVPFFIKPVTRMIAGKVGGIFLKPNFVTHFNFLNDQVKSAPDGGKYLCGDYLTAADIMMSFPLESAYDEGIFTKESHPELAGYVGRLRERAAHQKATQKIEETDPA